MFQISIKIFNIFLKLRMSPKNLSIKFYRLLPKTNSSFVIRSTLSTLTSVTLNHLFHRLSLWIQVTSETLTFPYRKSTCLYSVVLR